jgi:serine O-acetyltransferase
MACLRLHPNNRIRNSVKQACCQRSTPKFSSSLRGFAIISIVSAKHQVTALSVTSPFRHLHYHISTRLSQSSISSIVDHASLSIDDVWEEHYDTSQSSTRAGSNDEERQYRSPSHSYVSHLISAMSEVYFTDFISKHDQEQSTTNKWGHYDGNYIDEPYRHLRFLRRQLPDPLWAQIRLEAEHTLKYEPDAGTQLYQHVLRHPSLIAALASIVSHEIATELMPATALQALVQDQLRLSDEKNIHLDVIASVNRNPTEDSTALDALLFHQGLHALVCYRVAHRLWQAGRTGLAYYLQSTISSRYAADIHPAAKLGGGIYLSVGGGVVIGETASVGADVAILQGVTLGGTGKEVGDRHPKVEDGVILHCGATVLGNIRVGKGAVVTAKSIVTKEVPQLARVSGVPATVKSFRELRGEGFKDEDVVGEEDVECDLDCKMRNIFKSYFEELEALVEMELCVESGDNDCWTM